MTEASPLSSDFWRLLRREEATTFGGVPYFYEILKKLRFGRMDLPSLKYLTQAGGRLEPDLLLEFRRICRDKGWRFVVMYGQTEATARMSWLPWEEAFSRPASIGRAIPGGRFWLADDDHRPIDRPGEVGELVYEGPNVTLGYAENRHDLAKGDEREGRLFTGDLARFDEDGFFYLAGRKKRFLKLFGSRVNLDEIETRLNQDGLDCACAGEDDRLAVYVTDEKLIPRAEKYLSERLALNRAGFRIAAVKEIPRNEAGKILYADLS
jgi:acyl-coenzyme A synthetase/AMP-(fatty) acid ligase